MLFTRWAMLALLPFDLIKGQTEIGQLIYINPPKCHFSALAKSRGNQEQRSHLWVTWEPRKLDMVSSRFCRRSSTFCTVLFLWDSGSVGKKDNMFKVDIMLKEHYITQMVNGNCNFSTYPWLSSLHSWTTYHLLQPYSCPAFHKYSIYLFHLFILHFRWWYMCICILSPS